MERNKLAEELKFIARHIRGVIGTNASFADPQLADEYEELRAVARVLDTLARELNPDKSHRPLVTMADEWPECEDRLRRYREWYHGRLKPLLR